MLVVSLVACAFTFQNAGGGRLELILKKILTRFDFTQFWDSRDPKHVHAHSARFVFVGSVCAPALHGSDAGKEQRLHASSGAKCLLAEVHAA